MMMRIMTMIMMIMIIIITMRVLVTIVSIVTVTIEIITILWMLAKFEIHIKMKNEVTGKQIGIYCSYACKLRIR